MFEKDNFDKAIVRLKKKGYLKEFFNKTFNYTIDEDNKFDFYLQKINDDVMLYIYEKKDKNLINAYEFIDDDNDVYIEKATYKGIVLNTVHIKKCIKMYEENNIVDNIILFAAAINSKNPKKILLEYLSKKVVNELLKKD